MKKCNIFTNFYTPLSGEDLVFEGSLPTISEPEEEKQTNEVNADWIVLDYRYYDLNKQNKEWLLLIEELGLSKYSTKDWLSELTEITYDMKNNNFNITYSHNLDAVQLSWIFDVQYLRMSIEEAAEKHLIDKSQVKGWINEFNKNLKIRSLANRRYLNKSKLLNQTHNQYLLKRWCCPFAKPYTLNELSEKLANEFTDLGKVSNSTISRVLKNELSMGYRKLSKLIQRWRKNRRFQNYQSLLCCWRDWKMQILSLYS